MKEQAINYLKGAVRSYALMFFSNSLWLGLVVMGITFFDLVAGVSGLIAIAVCQIASRAFHFNNASVLSGAYTYNALMVGLALGGYYEWSTQFLAVLVIASLLCLFITAWMSGKLDKHSLPMLSVPFLLTLWVLLLGLFNFSGVKLSVKAAFSMQQWLPNAFSATSDAIDRLPLRNELHLYLRSLSATIFQYNDLAGIIIAIAVLIRSRMMFALSIYGFLIGYGFYHFFEGDFTPLIYSYIGFNFILTAIALGGIFIVPSARSHLLLLCAIPITALLLSALHTVFNKLGLPLYSLPFTLVVLLILGALKMRYFSPGLDLVVYQQYSPEENHYKHVYYQKRFAGQFYFHLHLPVMGEWRVSQGYAGDITHRDEWQHALDFDIADERGRTFTGSGFLLKDYYCYDLPVLAPAAGYVTTVRNGIYDNAIGEINLSENWGNTIIIRHADGLYTKLSHLKPQSLKVKEGDYVQRGEMIASCGSSGRSPEPHLHFQTQANPFIGSHTMRYPVAYYLVKNGDRYAFHDFDVPAEHQVVRNVIATPALTAAFGFIPGEDIVWRIDDRGGISEVRWSVYVDSTNRSYVYCHQSGAAAYFYNDGVLTYFTDFYGSRASFLHMFYLSFQKVLLGHYSGVMLKDWLLPQTFFNPLIMAAQDFLAPAFHFLEGQYHFRFAPASESGTIIIETESYGRAFGRTVKKQTSVMRIRPGGIESVSLQWKNRTINARCVR